MHLRAHKPGDIGWVIARQTRLYAGEYGWTGEYEALACEICANFLRDFKPGKEFCWIAEQEGKRVGAVFLVHRNEEEGQLRLLHVEPVARGAGVGKRLVAECISTAKAAGYRKIVLWTNDVLAAARRIYEHMGFKLVSEEPEHSFGKHLHGQMWELDLTRSADVQLSASHDHPQGVLWRLALQKPRRAICLPPACGSLDPWPVTEAVPST